MYADVILPLKLPGALIYEVPGDFVVSAGCRVVVPVGESKHYTGVVLRVHDERPEGDFVVKRIAEVLDTPIVRTATSEDGRLPLELRLWQWIADYYLCTLGDVMRAALPARLRDGKRHRWQQQVGMMSAEEVDALPELNEAQRAALDAIEGSDKMITLLHGVTASGKTAIYMHLIEHALKADKQGRRGRILYLVPEIALTTQLEGRLRAVFGEKLGCYHSKMSEAERNAVWMRQLSDDPYPIILGARSSVFLPWEGLRLVIVDEEHEPSYKQQEPAPRYHARNVALMLARMSNARVVMGSATPAIESYYHARKGRYQLVGLTQPYQYCETSVINRMVVDVGELRRKKRMRGIISPPLVDAMKQALANNEQVILFQNRRGWASLIECKDCGWVPKCARCDMSLTMHKQRYVTVCHTCGATYAMPKACPKCGGADLRSHGVGTEKVEDEVRKLFGEARVARLDIDAARRQDDYKEIIDDFASGSTNILIGTQMVAKGLDFSRVSVVGILAADTALNVPDFRAYERAYELMTQVAGRAGRRGQHSTIIIQTRQPELSVIHHTLTGNYFAHYKEVMQERLDFTYPPFCRLIDIYFRHRYENVVEEVARNFVSDVQGMAEVEVLGPDAPATARAAGLYIRKAVVKVRATDKLAAVKQRLSALYWHYTMSPEWHQPSIVFDVDPMN